MVNVVVASGVVAGGTLPAGGAAGGAAGGVAGGAAGGVDAAGGGVGCNVIVFGQLVMMPGFSGT